VGRNLSFFRQIPPRSARAPCRLLDEGKTEGKEGKGKDESRKSRKEGTKIYEVERNGERKERGRRKGRDGRKRSHGTVEKER